MDDFFKAIKEYLIKGMETYGSEAEVSIQALFDTPETKQFFEEQTKHFLKIDEDLYMLLLLAKIGGIESGSLEQFKNIYSKIKTNNPQFSNQYRRIDN